MNQHHENTPLQQWLGWMTEYALAAMPGILQDSDKSRVKNFFDSLQSALLNEAFDEETRKNITTLIAKVKKLSADNNVDKKRIVDLFIQRLRTALQQKAEKHSQHIADRLMLAVNPTAPLLPVEADNIITINYAFISKKASSNGQAIPRQKEKAFITRMLDYLSQQTDGRVKFNYAGISDNAQPEHLLIGQHEPPLAESDASVDPGLHKSQSVRQAAFEVGLFLGLLPLSHEDGSAADSMMALQSAPATQADLLFYENYTGRLHPADIVRQADIIAINALIDGIKQQIHQKEIEEFMQYLDRQEMDFSVYTGSEIPEASCDALDKLVSFLVGSLPDRLPVPWTSILARLNLNEAANTMVAAFHEDASHYQHQADRTKKVYTVSFPAVTYEENLQPPLKKDNFPTPSVRNAIADGLFTITTLSDDMQKEIRAILDKVASITPMKFRLASLHEEGNFIFRMYHRDFDFDDSMMTIRGFVLPDKHNAQHEVRFEIWLNTAIVYAPDRLGVMIHEILHASGAGHYEGPFFTVMVPDVKHADIVDTPEIQPVERLALQKIHGKRIPDSAGDQNSSLHPIKTDGSRLASSYRIVDFGGHSDTLRFISSAASDAPVSHTSLKIKKYPQDTRVAFHNGINQVLHEVTIPLKPHAEIEFIEFQYTQQRDRMYRFTLNKQADALQWENWRFDGDRWQQDNTEPVVKVHVETRPETDVISQKINRVTGLQSDKGSNVTAPVTGQVFLFAEWMVCADSIQQTAASAIDEITFVITPILYAGSHALTGDL